MSGNFEVVSAPSLRRFPLRGIERYLVAEEGVSTKCNHSILMSGDVATLLGLLPTAVMNTFNRHPRMRATLVKDELYMAEVQPPVTLETVSERRLLRVREFSDSEEDAKNWANWGKFVEEECSHGFYWHTQFMFYLTVWANKEAGRVRFMLFSDHIVSDGDSGLVAINDILEQAVLLSHNAPEEIKEFPLRPSLYDVWFASPWWLQPLAKIMVTLFGQKSFIEAAKAFTPVLPAREDQHDYGVPFKQNSTTAIFAEGSPERMRQTLARCKEENVSFTGALIPMVVLAYYAAQEKKDAAKEGGGDDVFRLGTELNYNLRKRVPYPTEETQVGIYVVISTLPFLKTEGVDMAKTTFWDLARRTKEYIVAQSSERLDLGGLPLEMMHSHLNLKSAPAFLDGYHVKNGVTSDANVSSVGRYPFKKEHQFAGDGVITLQSMHTFSSVPFLCASATMWVSSLNSFNYSIGHKVEDTVGEKLFKALVAICEDTSSIGKDETMLDVFKRMEASGALAADLPATRL